MRVDKPSPEAIVQSAIALARAILEADGLPPHKRELLKVCIWKVTEAEGKYNLRYWSEGVLDLVQKHGNIRAVAKLKPLPLRHEHVTPRSHLVQAMLDNPADIERILREVTTACLVTKGEHLRLKDHVAGFERYKQAGIRVWDTEQKTWVM